MIAVWPSREIDTPGCGATTVRITSYNVCYTKLLRIDKNFDGLSSSALMVVVHSNQETIKDPAFKSYNFV